MPADLSPSAAEEIVRRVAPKAAVVGVVARTGGQLSTIYEVRCADPDDSVIVKVYAEQWRWKQAKEAHVYDLLARHGVGPVPVVLHAESAGGVLDQAFTVLSRLPGRPLSEAEPDEAGTRRIYTRLGAILAAVHGIGQDSYGYLTTRVLEPQPTNTAYMTGQFAKKLHEFTELGGDPALHRAVTSHVAERVELFGRCPAPVLCHNDFHEGNVLVADGAVTGFIDVENAIAADPLMDLAKTDYYAVQGADAKLSALVDGYGPLPGDWRDRLAVYRLYHALELWDWFAAIGHTAPLPGIAEDIRQLVVA